MERFARLDLPRGPWARETENGWILLDAAPWIGGRPTSERADAGVGLLAPVAPTKVVAYARTYPKHAAELGNQVPSEPLLFLKPPSAVIGPDAPIRLPDVGRVDAEGELALVLGRRLVDATAGEAREAVFGITALNDVSARVFQRSEPTWARAKGYDSFCPIGPVLVSGVDPRDLAVQTAVNGEVRAFGRTSDMVLDPFELVAWASRIFTLEPGDVVATGTPPGVDAIVPGDRVEVTVEGVGTLRNPVVRR